MPIVRIVNRRHRWMGTLFFLFLFSTAIATLTPISTVAQQSSNPVGNQGRQITLHDQLTAGLKAFTPADRKFIDEVVQLVQQGKLPRRLVDSTFLWARYKSALKSPTRRLRPMVYFRPALVLRAKRIGVDI